jgi:hypothetical protein
LRPFSPLGPVAHTEPVLIADGDDERMVPSDLSQPFPNGSIRPMTSMILRTRQERDRGGRRVSGRRIVLADRRRRVLVSLAGGGPRQPLGVRREGGHDGRRRGDLVTGCRGSPFRLQMLSLLIGAELGADEVAGELDITLANAWDDLHQLMVAGLLHEPGVENVRGRRARGYGHGWGEEPARSTRSAEEAPVGMSTAFFVSEDKAAATAAARAPSSDAAA